MLYTGMRVGEIGALRWADVDFDKKEIKISHTLLFEEKPGQKGSVFSLNPPKTKTSERCIPMSSRVREALLTEKRRQKLNGLKSCITIGGYTDFVFLDDKGGLTLNTYTDATDEFKKKLL